MSDESALSLTGYKSWANPDINNLTVRGTFNMVTPSGGTSTATMTVGGLILTADSTSGYSPTLLQGNEKLNYVAQTAGAITVTTTIALQKTGNLVSASFYGVPTQTLTSGFISFPIPTRFCPPALNSLPIYTDAWGMNNGLTAKLQVQVGSAGLSIFATTISNPTITVGNFTNGQVGGVYPWCGSWVIP